MHLIDILPSDAPLLPAAPGKIIFAKGEHGDVMYVLIEGEAEIMIDGKLLETVHSGGILGEMTKSASAIWWRAGRSSRCS